MHEHGKPSYLLTNSLNLLIFYRDSLYFLIIKAIAGREVIIGIEESM